MHQLALGASFAFAGAMVYYAWRRCRASLAFLVVTPLLMGAGAIWAVVPDLPRVVGRMELYQRLAKDPRMDIFLWHYSIDHCDRIDPYAPWHLVPAAIMLSALLFIAWRELRLREKGIASPCDTPPD